LADPGFLSLHKKTPEPKGRESVYFKLKPVYPNLTYKATPSLEGLCETIWILVLRIVFFEFCLRSCFLLSKSSFLLIFFDALKILCLLSGKEQSFG
jgi:hypothetical protein